MDSARRFLSCVKAQSLHHGQFLQEDPKIHYTCWIKVFQKVSNIQSPAQGFPLKSHHAVSLETVKSLTCTPCLNSLLINTSSASAFQTLPRGLKTNPRNLVGYKHHHAPKLLLLSFSVLPLFKTALTSPR